MEISISLFLLSLLGAVQISSTESSVCPESTDVQLEHPLRIGAWNLQKLDNKKMGKPELVNTIVKVMLRYDIILVQGIVHSPLQVPFNLLEKLNVAASDNYDIALSKPVGTTTKERYAFYYNTARVILRTVDQYPDHENAFEYEPFIAVFDIPFAETETIALIGIHTSPNYAANEISALVQVYDDVVEQQKIEDVLILGDFNAGCTYVTEDEWALISLRTDQRFEWLISDHIDTTVEGTTCPYDRIVAAGSALKAALYEDTAKPFHFDEERDISQQLCISQELAENVCDHYPVEVSIRGRVTPSPETQTKVEVGVSVKVESNKSAVESLKQNYWQFTGQTTNSLCGTNPRVLIEQSLFSVEFQLQTPDNVIALLDNLNLNHPCVLTTEAKTVLKYKLFHNVLTDTAIHEERLSTDLTMRLLVLCRDKTCTVSLMSTFVN